MLRSGLGTSSAPDMSRPETLTSEASGTCEPLTCAATHNVISSPVSAAGHSLCVSPDGQTNDLFGQVPAHANHSAKLDAAKPSATTATSGRSGIVSSASVALQLSLESRLRQAMESNGPTGPGLILKPLTMPSQRRYCRLTRQAPTKSENDFILLPTPSAQTQEGGLRIDGGSRSRARWKELGLSNLGTAGSVAMAGWLMGYPDIWQSLSPGALATPSSLNSAPPSSAPQPDDH